MGDDSVTQRMTADDLQEHVLRRMTEREWQRQVRQAAEARGWWVFFIWTSLHSPRGWPDLTMLRDRLIFAELKSETGRLSSKQQDVLLQLTAAGQECYVWRPSDWDAVLEALK